MVNLFLFQQQVSSMVRLLGTLLVRLVIVGVLLGTILLTLASFTSILVALVMSSTTTAAVGSLFVLFNNGLHKENQ
jgi:ABC-type multidrug transport system permease subunit